MKQDYILSSELKIETRPVGKNAWVLSPKGSIDSSTANQFRNKLEELCEPTAPAPHLLLDIAGVKYISSMGLGSLLASLKKSKENGSILALYDAQLAVKRVLEISKLDFLILQPDKLTAEHPFAEYVRSEEPERRKRHEAAEAENQKKESSRKNK